MFSLVGRSQGEWGWAKYTATSVARENAAWAAISLPWSQVRVLTSAVLAAPRQVSLHLWALGGGEAPEASVEPDAKDDVAPSLLALHSYAPLPLLTAPELARRGLPQQSQ